MRAGAGGSRPPILVIVLAAAFLLLVAALVIGALTKPEFPPYHLTTAAEARPAGDTLVGSALYTLDASSTDEWQRFAFARGATVSAGSQWDLAFRRFHVVAGAGAGIQDLGAVPFDSVPPRHRRC